VVHQDEKFESLVTRFLLYVAAVQVSDVRIATVRLKHLSMSHVKHPSLRNTRPLWAAGSIPAENIGFFNLSNPSSRTLTLGSTQSLRESRNLPVVTDGRSVRLITSQPSGTM
jgi:hypothetical protein